MRGRILALLAGALLLGPIAQADDRDTSADASHSAVADSTGVILRVPINARGDENTDAAELAVTHATGTVEASKLPTLWNSATVQDRSTALSRDSSTSSDSSTWGWYGWYGYGWRNPYYYSSYYTPYYNYYGSSYGYYGSYYGYYPSYYNSYGYRYYYYPRYWY